MMVETWPALKVNAGPLPATFSTFAARGNLDQALGVALADEATGVALGHVCGSTTS